MAGTGGPMGAGGVGSRTVPASQFFLDAPKVNVQIYFQSVSGIGSETEVLQEKQARKGDYHSIRMEPGRLNWTPVVCKGGLTVDKDLWTWRKMVEDGKVDEARTNCSIVALAADGQTEVARWNFINAWPSKISGPGFDSQQNAGAFEEMTLVHEGLTRE